MERSTKYVRSTGAGHPFVHEAAHAVAAVDRDLRFLRVKVLSPHRSEATEEGEMLGWFDPGPAARTWVRRHPRLSFEVMIAGFLAEEALLGHSLPEGYIGDLRFWRRHMDLTDAVTYQILSETLGSGFDDVVHRVERWVGRRQECIRRVVSAMSGVADVGAGARLELRDEWVLEEDQVRSLMTADRNCCGSSRARLPVLSRRRLRR